VQAKRRALQQNKLDEAVRAYRFKQMMGETFNPAENGFVFSLEQIRLASRGCLTASGPKFPSNNRLDPPYNPGASLSLIRYLVINKGHQAYLPCMRPT
jgi:hypothetical protein